MTKSNLPHFDVIVVGAGFAGLYLVKRLRDQGFSVRAFDAAPGVGGTWYWNCYPGARCDLESFDYAYSFSPELEQEWRWSERYPAQPEILRYLNFVADRFDLRPYLQLGTGVTAAAWDDARALWTVTTSTDEQVEARFCIMAGGGLSVPKPPEIDGIETFKGEWYHTGQWPHENIDFTGKKVAVIGTGSSGVQCATTIVDQVAQLAVFQRTPNYTVPVINYPLDEKMQAEFRRNAAERHRIARHSRYGLPLEFPTLSALSVDAAERQRTYENAWRNSHLLAFRLTYGDILTNEAANDTVAEFLRGKIRGIVKDPATAEALIPRGFPFGTKRPCLGKDYYEMFNRDNVRLVDLQKTPIVRITPSGIETSEGERAFDCIIFATGFDALTGAASRIDIRGRGGLPLRKKWQEGPRAFLGLATSEFPNLFFITGPGSPGPLSNMVNSIEQHVEWVGDCLGHLRNHGLAAIESKKEADEAWTEHVQQVVAGTLYLRANSWYLGANVPGKPRVFMPYLGGVGVYRAKCDEVSKSGYEGFRLRPA